MNKNVVIEKTNFYNNIEDIKNCNDLATSLSQVIKKWEKIMGHDDFLNIFGVVYDSVKTKKNLTTFETDALFNKRVDAEMHNMYQILSNPAIIDYS